MRNLNHELENNGLSLIKVSTFAEPKSEFSLPTYEKLTELLLEEMACPSYVVAYLDHAVMVGLLDQQELNFYHLQDFQIEHLQTLRVFNSTSELLVWRNNRAFQGRLREDKYDDDERDKEYIVVAEQVLWGTNVEHLPGGWSYITEERGFNMVVPLEGVRVDQKGNRLKIKTHNYIGFNELGLAGYVDTRFVNFTGGGIE